MSQSDQLSAELAIAVAQLVSELGRSAATDALRTCLLTVCDRAACGDVVFTEIDGTLCANDQAVDAPETALKPLIAALQQHGVAVLSIEALASPKELLLMANMLSEPSSGPTARLDVRAHQLGCWHVGFTMHSEREAAMASEEASASGQPRATVSSALACATPADAITFAQGLTEQLQSHALEKDVVQCTHLLLDLLRMEHHTAALGESAEEIGAVWSATFDQLASASILQLVAQLLPSSDMPRADVLAVLQRAGDSGAGALIARLIGESGRVERRALFDAIVEMGAGLPLLLRSLGHPTWYVVRNAASLLGAMKATGAEAGLVQTLGHADERVRLATTTALARIATPAACAGLNAALRDRAATVRHRAFRALLTLGGSAINAAALGDALELERNAGMQRELLAALVATRSTDAVQRMVKLCSPSSRGAFPAELRVSMLEALLQLRPTTAMPLLRMAAEDRDPAVRRRARELVAKPVAAAARETAGATA